MDLEKNKKPIKSFKTIHVLILVALVILAIPFISIITTLEKESDLPVVLPPKNIVINETPVADRNMLEIAINKDNHIFIEGKAGKTNEDVIAAVLEFMENPNNSENYPEMDVITAEICIKNINRLNIILENKPSKTNEKKLAKWKTKLKTVELVGDYRTINETAVIAIKYSKSTAYGSYLQVRDNVMIGINQLRNKLSKQKFGVTYKKLMEIDETKLKENPAELLKHKAKIKAIRTIYPQKVIKIEM